MLITTSNIHIVKDQLTFASFYAEYFVRNSAQANKPETNYHNYIQTPIIFNYTF